MKIILFQTIQFSISMHFKCKYSLIEKTFLFQAIRFSQAVLIQLIQFSISTDFIYPQLNVKTVLYYTIQVSVSTFSISKTIPFQTIQFSISMRFKCKYSLIVKNIKPKDKGLSGATTLAQNGAGSNDNKGVLCIPQSPRITGTSLSDYLVSYPSHSLGGVIPLCRGAVSVFYSPIRLGKSLIEKVNKSYDPSVGFNDTFKV